MKNGIKLIAIDLDGTLLDSRLQITPHTQSTLQRAVDAGVQVVIATGRPFHTAAVYVQQLGLKSPGVFMQGLTICNSDGSVRRDHRMNPETARKILSFAQEHGYTILIYNSNRIFARQLDALTEAMSRFYEQSLEVANPLLDLPDREPINKIVFFNHLEHMDSMREHLADHIGDEVTLFTSQAHMLEALPPGSSKGTGLRLLLDDLGIAPEHVLAIGDGENDIDMLQLAGYSVAMGNASEHVKQHARYVTAGNDEDGVALAVEQYVL